MNRGFYAKLAVSNMKKNRQFMVPYLLTGVFMVMMFYMIGALSGNPDLLAATGSSSVLTVMRMAVAIVGIFSVIMLFYADSFLMKRRKKELGLYNILGMEKKHVGRMLFWETLYAYLIALAAGVACGILFSKLIFMLAEKALHMSFGMKFYVSLTHLRMAALLFGLIYLVSYLIHLIQLKVNRPVELLRGGNVGEREPKTKWIIAVLGLLCLAIGYFLALTIENPIQALSMFFVAVLFVIAGTYLTFTAGTIALLKMLRRNKKYYYKTKHFTAVSGLIYRMKQNAVGLSSICILATAVLVLVSVTFSLYNGVEKGVTNNMLANTRVEINVTEEKMDSVGTEDILQLLSEEGYDTANAVDYYYLSAIVLKEGDTFYVDGESLTSEFYSKAAAVYLIDAEDYKKLTGKDAVPEPGHVFCRTLSGPPLEDSVKVLNSEWIIDGEMEVDGIPGIGDIVNSYVFVVPDRTVLTDMAKQASDLYVEYYQEENSITVTHSMHFDIVGSEQTQNEGIQILQNRLPEIVQDEDGIRSYQIMGKSLEISEGYKFYGGFLFIGIFLAIVFMMGTVLIIYYKQMSEGYEDRERFQIMQKVGMSRREVRQSIRSQILIVFFLPLLTASIHMAVASPLIRKILLCFNRMDISAFGPCTVITILAFAAIYAIVYSITAKVYYKIVTEK